MTSRTASETMINLLGKQYAKNSPKPNAMTHIPFPEHFLRINLRPFVMSALILMHAFNVYITDELCDRLRK